MLKLVYYIISIIDKSPNAKLSPRQRRVKKGTDE